MNSVEFMHEQIKIDESLHEGQSVKVYWGYGLGFRAEGVGQIVKINAGSVQVQLSEDVLNPGHSYNPSCKIGWPKGFVLKGIPRYIPFKDNRWDIWNRVQPID